MNVSFTQHCREALGVTRLEAVRLGHPFVGPEHILLGLLQLDEGIASTALDRLGVDRETLRTMVVRDLPPSESTAAPAELPYTQPAVTVLEGAMREARDDGASPVHSGHLLLATVHGEGWPDDFGLDLFELRRGVETASRESDEPLDS